jgi:hypothetical protein
VNPGVLRRGGQVVLDGTGQGTVTLFPDTGSQRWEIERITIKTNQAVTQTPIPQCELFLDSVPISNSRGASYNGNNDTFDPDGGPIRVGPADCITLQWTGGIPGTIASCQIEGLLYGPWTD